MRIGFITNSLLATESIQHLHDKGLLHGIATMAKNMLLSSQVQQFAQRHDLQFAALHKHALENELNEWLRLTAPDLVIVQTFPYKIPAACLTIPALGFFNLHPGPLPEYRGPDPVFWQLKNGASSSGITLHQMDSDFDTGPKILFESIPIHPHDTYGLVNSHLGAAAVDAIEKFLILLNQAGTPILSPQDDQGASYQKKPEPNALLIDWSQQSSKQIANLTRASNPNQNGCITFFRGVMTRILEVDVLQPDFEANLQPGTILTADSQRGVQVKCMDNHVIRPTILHVEEGYYSGGRFMDVFGVQIGEKFTAPTFFS